jgi:hypothetical protein
MRKVLLLSAFLGTASPCLCQSTPAPSGWARVQAVSPNSSITVKARSSHASCKLQSVTGDTLTCLSHGNTQTFQLAEIISIKAPHRGRSTLAGAAIGAGAGVVIGAASIHDGFIGRGAGAIVIGVPGFFIGALVGAATDFTHAAIYKAP